MKMSNKVLWMQKWCEREGLDLTLEGECGFKRDCVGVLSKNGDAYPDYIWYDDSYENRIDGNEDVWTPEDAYHKHPCVAVLGRTSKSISQLYDWLKWFEDNNFHYKTFYVKCDDEIELLMGRDTHHTMKRGE